MLEKIRNINKDDVVLMAVGGAIMLVGVAAYGFIKRKKTKSDIHDITVKVVKIGEADECCCDQETKEEA